MVILCFPGNTVCVNIYIVAVYVWDTGLPYGLAACFGLSAFSSPTLIEGYHVDVRYYCTGFPHGLVACFRLSAPSSPTLLLGVSYRTCCLYVYIRRLNGGISSQQECVVNDSSFYLKASSNIL